VYTAGYDLLARLYLHGPQALRPECLPAVGSLLEALGHTNADWPSRIGELLSLHEQPVELERAQRDYMRAFVVPVPGHYVPPYASVYLDDGVLWGESTFRILRLYGTEGLSWKRAASGRTDGASWITAPDHIGVEFAFLALATRRRHRGPAEVKRQQRLTWLLGDHMDRWLPGYNGALIGAGAGPALEGWTAWAVDLTHSDLERRAAAGK
jgi:TorA maturation chaperone TorD